ncbi:hypothetical protein BGZ76_000021 [Entomortierella beljakovae]|nr:hypothetical protein BGZ76_000021 [Entomortierella beljakovae]
MPETIPRRVLIGRAIQNLTKFLRLILRGILVALIWFVMLPYFTIWVWRLYFWIGETFAFRLNGLETPLWNSTSFFTQKQNITATPTDDSSTAAVNIPSDGISQILLHSVAPEHQWISIFIMDCFEGQIISSVVVVVFVAIFLLREWVIQNQREGVVPDDPVAPMARVEPNAQGFNVEHAVERFIAAQHHIEAVVEGEAELSDSESESSDDEDQALGQVPPSQPLLDNSYRPPSERIHDAQAPFDYSNYGHEQGVSAQGIRPRRFWDIENAGEGSSTSGSFPQTTSTNTAGPLNNTPQGASGSNIASAPNVSLLRPTNERTFSADPTTGIYASTPTVDRSGRRPGGLDSKMNQGLSFRAPEDIFTQSDIQGASATTKIGDTHWIANSTSTSNEPSSPQHTLNSANIDDISAERIYSVNGELLYWKSGIPLTYENIFLKEDGNRMSYSEGLTRVNNLQNSEVLSYVDLKSLQSYWRSTHSQEDRVVVEQPNSREELIRQINERGIRARQNNNALREQNLQAVDPPIFQIPRAPPAAPLAAPLIPIAPPAPPAPPAPVPEIDDELDDFNIEEIDGILEVIGMRGSFWILLQNSLLMAALICASLGVGIWIPFMIGKTILLMNPLNILRIPLDVLSWLSDPILDYIFDRLLPYASTKFSGTIAAFNAKISPHLSGILSPYFGAAATGSFGALYEQYIIPAWNATAEILLPHLSQTTYLHNKSITSVVESLELGELSSNSINATTLHQSIGRWTEISYGGSPADKFIAIMIGYAVLFSVASWYFSTIRNTNGHIVTKLIRDFLSQQGYILKIALFVAIEMIVFPLFCGVVIGFSTLPLFDGASFATRYAFYKVSPFLSFAMDWFIGTAFMFNFSYFVGVCRGLVRTGVMWFIRDPNDEGFHPIREILERPVLLQLRKLCSGAFMYFTLIILGVTLTIRSVDVLMKGVLPLRWPVDEPISDLPIDLLLFHLVFPLTARWLNPTNLFKRLFEEWWRKLSHWLRLSSFMYASDGQRYYDEEGYFVYRSWKAWILRWRPPIPGMEGMDNDAAGSGEELDIDAPVIFVRDGGLLRVPNSDRIHHLKDRRVMVPVDENGNALDPNEDLPGETDPLTELQSRRREGLVDPKENTIIVYAPPYFKHRLSAFIVLLWVSVTSFLVLSAIIPSRAIFTLKTERHVHDIYAILVGVYALCGLWHISIWVSDKMQLISAGGIPPLDLKAQLKEIWRLCKLSAKIAYFGLTFGIIIPFVMGLMIELFVILPLRTTVEEKTSIIFVVNWAVGLLYMKIAHRVLTTMPNLEFAADLNRVFVGANVDNWDAGLATRRLIIPVLGVSIVVIGGPLLIAWVTVETLGLTGPNRLRVFRRSYPIVLMSFLIVYGLKESFVILQGWSQYVRDQEYLVGRQLHNLQEEVDEQGQQPQLQEQQEPQVDTTNENWLEHEDDVHHFGQNQTGESSVKSSDSSDTTKTTPDYDIVQRDKEIGIPRKEQEYPSRNLRSSSRLVKDPPLASELEDEIEGDSIAQRIRLRRRRALAQEET